MRRRLSNIAPADRGLAVLALRPLRGALGFEDDGQGS